MTDKPIDDILLRQSLLKSTLDSYNKDMTELVNIQPKQFETATITNLIMSTPPRKWHAAQGVVDAIVKKKEAEQKLKTTRAKFMLMARNNSSLKAAPDRSAWVDSQDATQEAEIEVINADANLQAAKLAYECLDDLFTAGKKIMDYLMEQDKATKQYNRYNEEARQST